MLYVDHPARVSHGTLKQMQALVELMKLDSFVDGIANHAVAKWYAEGQGIDVTTRKEK